MRASSSLVTVLGDDLTYSDTADSCALDRQLSMYLSAPLLLAALSKDLFDVSKIQSLGLGEGKFSISKFVDRNVPNSLTGTFSKSAIKTDFFIPNFQVLMSRPIITFFTFSFNLMDLRNREITSTPQTPPETQKMSQCRQIAYFIFSSIFSNSI